MSFYNYSIIVRVNINLRVWNNFFVSSLSQRLAFTFYFLSLSFTLRLTHSLIHTEQETQNLSLIGYFVVIVVGVKIDVVNPLPKILPVVTSK